MGQANQQLVELVLVKLAASDELLQRFLDAPVQVIAELSDLPVNQETLEAIGDGLRKRFAGELSDAELEGAVGGTLTSRLKTWQPMMGGTGSFSSVITNSH
jgi:hypothetical protein